MHKTALKAIKKAGDAALRAVGVTGPEDEEFKEYMSRLDKMDAVIRASRRNFEQYAAAMQTLTRASLIISDDLTRFYGKSEAHADSVQSFAAAQTQMNEANNRIFKDEFSWEIAKTFDDWLEETNRVRNNVKQAQSAGRTVADLADKIQKMKVEKRPKEEQADNEAKLQKYTTALANMRRSIETDVGKIVKNRFEQMDKCFIRLMECQQEYHTVATSTFETFSPNISAYRSRVPKQAAPRDRPSRNESKDEQDDGREGADSDGEPGGISSRPTPVISSPNGQARSRAPQPNTPLSTNGQQNDNHVSTPSSNSSRAPPQPNLFDLPDEQPPARSPTPGATTPAGPPQSRPPAVMDLFGGFSVDALVSQQPPPAANPPSLHPGNSFNVFEDNDPTSIFDRPPVRNGGNNAAASGFDLETFGNSNNNGISTPSRGPSKGQAAGPSTAPPVTRAKTIEGFDIAFDTPPQRPQSAAKTQPKGPPPSRAPNGFEGLLDNDGPAQAKSGIEILQEFAEEGNGDGGPRPNAVAELRSNWAVEEAGRVEKLEASVAVADRVKAWEQKDGVQKNIRTLLTSLDQILPPGTRWNRVGLGEVMDKKSIKAVYRKALMVVHPDKVRSGDAETKVISERVFEALNTAWDKYDKDPKNK